jgi:hypothetical protein
VRQVVAVRRGKRLRTTQRVVATTRGLVANLGTAKLRLRVGARYRFVVITRDAAGNSSAARAVTVRVTSASRVHRVVRKTAARHPVTRR